MSWIKIICGAEEIDWHTLVNLVTGGSFSVARLLDRCAQLLTRMIHSIVFHLKSWQSFLKLEASLHDVFRAAHVEIRSQLMFPQFILARRVR